MIEPFPKFTDGMKPLLHAEELLDCEIAYTAIFTLATEIDAVERLGLSPLIMVRQAASLKRRGPPSPSIQFIETSCVHTLKPSK